MRAREKEEEEADACWSLVLLVQGGWAQLSPPTPGDAANASLSSALKPHPPGTTRAKCWRVLPGTRRPQNVLCPGGEPPCALRQKHFLAATSGMPLAPAAHQQPALGHQQSRNCICPLAFPGPWARKEHIWLSQPARICSGMFTCAAQTKQLFNQC